MNQENFNVTWHNYTDHLRDMLDDMYFDDSFADVTLITDDKKQLKAHRNILSACSSVLKEILQINPNNNHPVIYLRGIQHSEMKSILKFIYSGESNFYEERMEEFLLVAKELGVKELGNNAEVGDSVVSAKNHKNASTGYNVLDEFVFDDIPGNQEALPLFQYSQEEENISETVRKRRHIKAAHEDENYHCSTLQPAAYVAETKYLS